MRVLTVLDHLVPFGGAERYAVVLGAELQRRGIQVDFCATRTGDCDLIQTLRQSGHEVIVLERKSRYDLVPWVGLRGLVTSYDLMHAHKFGSNVWSAVVGGLRSKLPPLIAHEHSGSLVEPWIHSALKRNLVARRASAIVAVSESTRCAMIRSAGLPAEKIVVIRPAIADLPRGSRDAMRERLGIANKAVVFVGVQVLRREKNVGLMIRAFAAVSRRVESHLIVVGDGPERAPLQALAGRLGIGARVSFVGMRSDVWNPLAAADVAVSTSRFEGTPLAVIEYMAAGLPLVAHAVGGVPEMVKHGVEGLLVTAGDLSGTVVAMESLALDPVRRAEMGSAARGRYESELSLERSADQTVALYRAVLT